MTNTGWRKAAKVVVAAGAWSRQLLEPLGVRIPLETERGYHAMLTSPGLELKLPISNKSRAFGVTPMEHGLRVAGTVEIAGLHAPPKEARAKVLLEHIRSMFPNVDTREHRFWMGYRPSTPDSLPVLGEAPGRAESLPRARTWTFWDDRRAAERPDSLGPDPWQAAGNRYWPLYAYPLQAIRRGPGRLTDPLGKQTSTSQLHSEKSRGSSLSARVEVSPCGGYRSMSERHRSNRLISCKGWG